MTICAKKKKKIPRVLSFILLPHKLLLRQEYNSLKYLMKGNRTDNQFFFRLLSVQTSLSFEAKINV